MASLETISLEDALSRGAKVVKPNDEGLVRALTASRKVPGFGPSSAPSKGPGTPTVRPGGLPPPQAETKEEQMGRIGKALSSVSKALQEPELHQILGQFGIAFAGGQANQPGTILGTAAVEGAQRQIQGRALEDIIAGKTPTGASPETIATGTQLREQTRRTDIEQQRADTDEMRVEGTLDLQGKELEEVMRSNKVAESLQLRGLAVDERMAALRAPVLEAQARLEQARTVTEQARASLVQAQQGLVGAEQQTAMFRSVVDLIQVGESSLADFDVQQSVLEGRIDEIDKSLLKFRAGESDLSTADARDLVKLRESLRERLRSQERDAMNTMTDIESLRNELLQQAFGNARGQ